MLVRGRALDREQEVPEVLGHPLDGGPGGLAEQSLFGSGLDAEDLLRVALPGGGESDEDLAPVGGIDVAPELGTPQRLRAVCAQMWRLD